MNQLELAAGVSNAQLEQFRANIWSDFENRVAGRPSERIDLYDDKANSNRIVSRMSSGTAMHRLEAMRRIDEIERDENIWRKNSSDRANYVQLTRTPVKEREQYEISKYHFRDLANPGNGEAIRSTTVMIDESQNTRLLGLAGQHNRFTDKLVVVDFEGYNDNSLTKHEKESNKQYLRH